MFKYYSLFLKGTLAKRIYKTRATDRQLVDPLGWHGDPLHYVDPYRYRDPYNYNGDPLGYNTDPSLLTRTTNLNSHQQITKDCCTIL